MKVGVKVDTKAERRSLVRAIISRIAWVWDRFDFWVIHRGERLRPKVRESIEQEIEDEKLGKVKPSPRFTNTKDMMDWLNS